MLETVVYGSSDDLIIVDGEIHDEISVYDGKDILLRFSDGTNATMRFAPEGLSIWKIQVLKKGNKFHELQLCESEEDSINSDILHFLPGITSIKITIDSETVELIKA